MLAALIKGYHFSISAFVKRAERRRGLLLRWGDLLAQVEESVADCWIG
jgi:hypothetical protein